MDIIVNYHLNWTIMIYQHVLYHQHYGKRTMGIISRLRSRYLTDSWACALYCELKQLPYKCL